MLVSGRSARELHDLLRPGIRAEIWGSHGREQLRSDGNYELFALNPVQQAALDQVGLEMSALGFSETLEVKPTSLAVHWRSFEPAMQEQDSLLVQSVFARIANQADCTCCPSMGVWSCARPIARREPRWRKSSPRSGDVPVAYLGDDLTDEDAFVAVGNTGYSVLVRSEVRASFARYWLRPPEELLEFLDTWIANSQSASSTVAARISR